MFQMIDAVHTQLLLIQTQKKSSAVLYYLFLDKSKALAEIWSKVQKYTEVQYFEYITCIVLTSNLVG